LESIPGPHNHLKIRAQADYATPQKEVAISQKKGCQKSRPSRKMRWAPRAIRQSEAGDENHTTPLTEVDARNQSQKKGCQTQTATPCHKLSGCQKIRLYNQRKAVPKKQTIPQNEVGARKLGYIKQKGGSARKSDHPAE
jgi:hypothetical protein